jgi:hypothetical protein
MNNFKALYYKFESFVSSAKFAVIIISFFMISLIYGTFMESYHGTDYANRLVYKSWWFIFLELCMFVSILMATIVRLPMKKRLYGFYVLHTGLLTIFIGSFFTYINGIDGSLQLLPNTPAQKLVINEDILKVSFIKSNKVFTLALPYTASSSNLNTKIENIMVKKFIPFADNKLTWKEIENSDGRQHSSSYMIFNDNMSQEFTLSLNTQSDFKSIQKMGLLNLHYMPKVLEPCFLKDTKSGYIIWNLHTGSCFSPEEKRLSVEKTDKGTKFLIFPHKGEYLKFFPDFSPVAINDDLSKNTDSPFRILSKNLFIDRPHLFLFGKTLSFYNKRKKRWDSKTLDKNIVKLPWMGFKLRLTRHEDNHYPLEIPTEITPVQTNNELVKGNIRAVLISFSGKDYWVRSDGPLELSNGKENIRFQITNKELKLPYQITLQKFVMNKNPGTNTPATYESFTQLLDGRDGKTTVLNNHIFMNNPLKYESFTFYQSSYFQIAKDQYGSVLSVNYDPGRFFKYLGSLLLVLGAAWHYYRNRKKSNKVT